MTAPTILRADRVRTRSRLLISLIVPVLNEESTIPRFYNEVVSVLGRLPDSYQFEFLFTDNCSSDRTFEILAELAATDPRIRVLRLSRNFGYQNSIFTGYLNARGDAAIQLDCDLQDPPQLIPEFLSKWRQGYDVVYGVRRSRKEGAAISALRRFFYALVDKLSDDDLPRDAGDFRLVSRRVIEALRMMDDSHPYLRGYIAAVGFRQIGIPYDRRERVAGRSKFSFLQLVRLAIDGILAHSILPLRIASITGLVLAPITFFALLAYLGGRAVFGFDWPRGFATTTILILLGITLNALFLGVIGEYVGRIYQQVKRRPIAIVERSIEHDLPADLPQPTAAMLAPDPPVGNGGRSPEGI